MDRRRYLGALGASATPWIVGCVGDSDPGSPGTDSGAVATTDGGTDRATPPAFPPDRDDVDHVRWYDDAEAANDGVVLEPDAVSSSLPNAEFEFTLRNRSDRTFQTNFYGWSVHRLEDSRWHRIAPTSVPQPLTPLPGGDSHTWTVRVDNEGLDDPVLRAQGTSDLDLRGLGSGTYAFAIDGWWKDQSATPSYEHQTVAAARFSIEGDPLELEPSNAVESVSREGETVTVAADNPSLTDDATEESHFGQPVTVVLRRTTAEDPRPIVTEQAYRHWPLRDALAVADDATEVRLETRNSGVPPFHTLSEWSPVRYDGRTYRASVEGYDRPD